MRLTRVIIYKKSRREKYRKILLFAIIVPAISIMLGYLISSIVILPTIAGK